MSSREIVAAAQGIVQGALAGATAQPLVVAGIPQTWADRVFTYVYHDGSVDVVKATSLVQRTHRLGIHLHSRVVADLADAELEFLDLTDALVNAFYTAHRLNNATGVQNATLVQDQGRPAYIVPGGENVEYRHRSWTLEVVEQLTITFA